MILISMVWNNTLLVCAQHVIIILLIVKLTSTVWTEGVPHTSLSCIRVIILGQYEQGHPSARLIPLTSCQIFIWLSNSTDNGCHLLRFFLLSVDYNNVRTSMGKKSRGKQSRWPESRVTREKMRRAQRLAVLAP